MSLQDKLKVAVSGEKPSLNVEEPAKLDDADTAAEGAWQESTIQEAILKTAFAEASSYEAPVGAYRNVRLHQVVLPSGEVVKPNKYGYYENLAGEAQGLLDFYATKGLVEKVVEKA